MPKGVAGESCGSGDERAQQRHLLGGEVAPVVAALDLAGHRGAARARLRASLIDHGSHGDRLSGGDIGLGATRTHARIVRRVALLRAPLELGPQGAAVTGGGALLAARAPRVRLVLPLALAPEHRPRQHLPGRSELLELGLQRLDARRQRRVLGLQLAHLGAQLGVVRAQRRDPLRRPPARGSQPGVVLAQPRHLHAKRQVRAALARLDAGLGKELLQTRHFAPQAKGVLRGAAHCLHLLDRRRELVPALVEVPLQHARQGTRLPLGMTQLFAARLRRVRPCPCPCPFALVVRPKVLRLESTRSPRRRPNRAAALDQTQAGIRLIVENRHAHDDSAGPGSLPEAKAPKSPGYRTDTVGEVGLVPALTSVR